MDKITEKNSGDLQKKLEEIIFRAKTQNRLLNKILEDLGSRKPVLGEITQKTGK